MLVHISERISSNMLVLNMAATQQYVSGNANRQIYSIPWSTEANHVDICLIEQHMHPFVT